MRAMAYDAYGSDGVLTLRELPDPKVGPGEVRIRVRRAGVKPVDWKVMAGGLDGLGRMADAGQLHVPVADVLPLEELPAAIARSLEGHVRGKLVISVPD